MLSYLPVEQMICHIVYYQTKEMVKLEVIDFKIEFQHG